MNRLWRRIVRNAIGAVCICIGIIGGFIPVLQGWMFILAGLLLIDWPGRRWLLERSRRTQTFRKAEAWLHRRFAFRFDDDDDSARPPGADGASAA